MKFCIRPVLYVDWITCCIWAILISFILFGGCGCSAIHSTVPNSTPAVGSSINKAEAHTESADRLVVAAKPESNDTGKKLLTAASDEHTATLLSLKQAEHDLDQVQSERDQLDRSNSDLTLQLTKIKSQWGYRLQVWVTRFVWILVGLIVAHFVLGAAGLFVTGPAGAIMATLGAVVNPFSWFQTARDNIHFRSQA